MNLKRLSPILRTRSLPAIAATLALSLLLPDQSTAEITPDGLKQAESKVQNLARENLAATVSLIPGGNAPRFGTGSGVIVSRDGLVLTAAHVAMEMNEKVTVIFPDGNRAEAKVLGMDYSRDAAMLQIMDKGEYPFVDVGESDEKKENDWCIALGHAGGYQADRTPPIRLGRVIENDTTGFMVSDCVLIGGDSGGPLFDIDGKLIGIHSNIGWSLSQNRHVPISTFVANWERLKKGDRFGGNDPEGLIQNPDRPIIGALLGDAEMDAGAVIERIMPGSPAGKAGLKEGDTVVKAGDTDITGRQSLMKVIGKHKAGDTLKLLVQSKDEEKEVSIELAPVRKFRGRMPGPRRRPQLEEPRNSEKEKDREPGKKNDVPKESEPDKGKKAEKKDAPKKTETEKPDKKDAPKSAGKKEPKKDRATLQAEFNDKIRKSLETGRLELNPEDMERYGGIEKFMEFMQEFEKSMTEEDLDRLANLKGETPVRPGSFDPDQPMEVSEGFFRDVLNAFRPSVAVASDATHLVFRGRDWKSLCTIVHADGYALTKASEIDSRNNQALTVMLSKDEQAPASIVKTFPKYDLALLKLDSDSDLTPVAWHQTGDKLTLGSFISAAGSGPDALAIGVVSVQARSLTGQNKGFLGIATAPHEKGVQVARVVPDSSAAKGGLKNGDIITRIGKAVCDTPEKLIKAVSGTKPGDAIEVHFIRKGKSETKEIQLGDRSRFDKMAQVHGEFGTMNRYGTELSERSGGFQNVIQTDLPIQPQECGGPVVDLNGNVIGLNIARAGRIKTFALPAVEIAALLDAELKPILKKAKKKGKKPVPAE